MSVIFSKCKMYLILKLYWKHHSLYQDVPNASLHAHISVCVQMLHESMIWPLLLGTFLSWLRSKASVSAAAAISCWSQTHIHTERWWERGTRSLGPWNSSLINRPKYHLISHHGKGQTEEETEGGDERRWGNCVGKRIPLNSDRNQTWTLCWQTGYCDAP